MRTAITGGSGFIGRHVADELGQDNVVIISRRTGVSLDDVDQLAEAFMGCETVVHCAGINREIRDQTYERVHVQGTRNVVEAAKLAGVKKIIMLSFLNARPGSGSPYHETKWQGEEMVRSSGLDYTILKSGMVYGRGDHMVDHLSHSLFTVPVFGAVGVTDRIRTKTIRPIPVEEVTTVIVAAVNGRLPRETVEVVGAEELFLAEAVRRIAGVLNRPVYVLALPVWSHRIISQVAEATMKVPLVAKAQLRMLTEGISEGYNATELPQDLKPKLFFTDEQIRKSLPEPGRFTFDDLLFSSRFKKL